MHRSGTSVLSRSLKVMGVDLGDDLIPPEQGINEKGYWEDEELNHFNNEILEHLGMTWTSIRSVSDIDVARLKDSGYFEKAESLLSEKSKDKKIWGFKDPRVSKLLKFWNEIFRLMAVDVHYLLSLRNPVEVAKSLVKRDSLDPTWSYLLWLEYTLSAMAELDLKKSIFVHYRSMLEDPQFQIEKMARKFELKINQQEMIEFKNEFIDTRLRHHLNDQEDLDFSHVGHPLANEVYKRLKEDSRREKVSEVLHGEIIKWRKEYQRMEKLLLFLDDFFQNSLLGSQQASLSSRQFQFSMNEIRSDQAYMLKTLSNRMHKEWGPLSEHMIEMKKTFSSELEKTQQDSLKLERLYEKQVEELNNNLAGLRLESDTLKRKLRDSDDSLSEIEGELIQLTQSNAWRVLQLCQALRRNMITTPRFKFVSLLRRGRDLSMIYIRKLWRTIPLSPKGKYQVKKFIFRTTPGYNAWRTSNNYFEASAESLRHEQNFPEMLSGHVPLLNDGPLLDPRALLIAFYLPQFHAIKENDEWWGEGFTEWTNVRAAKAQFSDHDQPKTPGELGYYDLTKSDVQRRQVELARLYGIGAFCFYFYWFGGKRLLEKPILQFMENEEIDFPFCLCWANESWTRRWDGLENEQLISQKHTPEDDLEFIKYVSKYLRSRQYLRIESKPLMIVYRPDKLPSVKETVTRWREWCRSNGIGEIYVAYTQSFESVSPAKYGMDAAIEFPPNNSSPPIVNDKVSGMSEDFRGVVYDLSELEKRSHHFKKEDYRLYRGVCPSWDNTARRKKNAGIFINSSPKQYQSWLTNAIDYSVGVNEDMNPPPVFINAWNEWAEGCYLEPDAKSGYAYLQATRNALVKGGDHPNRILLVSHDCYGHGAQMILLNIAKFMALTMKIRLDLVTLEAGPLLNDFKKYARVHIVTESEMLKQRYAELLSELSSGGCSMAIVNTTVCGKMIPILKEKNFYVLSLIHELPQLIMDYELESHTEVIAQNADKVVFPTNISLKGFRQFTQLDDEKVVISPQGIYKSNQYCEWKDFSSLKKRLREHLGLPRQSKVVLSVAFGDKRKGIDIFIESGLLLARRIPSAYFVWVGNIDPIENEWIDKRLKSEKDKSHFIFSGFEKNTDLYYAGADIYALTSREDPFPTVVMEALEVGTPVVAFTEAGGSTELLGKIEGLLVDDMSVEPFSEKCIELLLDEQKAKRLGNIGKEIVRSEYSFPKYVFDLACLGISDLKKVSVIVPNFNYADYLPLRIQSILSQTYPIYEVIILDDHSSDASMEVLKELIKNVHCNCQIIENDANSGNVFKQWKKGVDLVKGDYVWIAEADDFSDPLFLEKVMEGFLDFETNLSYSQSQQVDESGNVLSENYLEYVDDISTSKWCQNYRLSGREEIRTALSIKNTIPNVSGVVFRKKQIASVMEDNIHEIMSYRNAGDWLVYIYLLSEGNVFFCREPLNFHRRHGNSATQFDQNHFDELKRIQDKVKGLYDLDKGIQEKSLAYLKKLEKEFPFASGVN